MVETLNKLPQAEPFDIVLSKDTFEHVQDLDHLLKGVAQRVRQGGLLVCGFSPLYYSPNGDHARYDLPLPWMHAFLPDDRCSGGRHTGSNARSDRQQTWA